MMSRAENKVELEKIIGTDCQINKLYDLVKKRTHNISSKGAPLKDEHIKFVQNHPYRAWYLIKVECNYIGSVYLLKNNCVGVNLVSDFDVFPEVVQLVLKKYKPLREIKSVRPSYFYINISPDNKEIEHELFKLNARKIQSTFILNET